MKTANTYIGLILFALFGTACQTAPEPEAHEEDGNGHFHLSKQLFESNSMRFVEVRDTLMGSFHSLRGQLAMAPQGRYELFPFVSGKLSDIQVNEGEEVKRGQIIAVLESRELADLQQAYLEVVAQLKYLESDYARKAELQAVQMAPVRDVQRLLSERDAALAKKRGLEGQLRMMNAAPENWVTKTAMPLGRMELRSPINGRLSALDASNGRVLTADERVAVIDDPAFLRAEFQVFGDVADHIQPGDSVELNLPSDPEGFHGQVLSISPWTQAGSQSFSLTVVPTTPWKVFLPGLQVQGRIYQHPVQRTVCPEEASSGDPESPLVFVLLGETDTEYELKTHRLNSVEQLNGHLVSEGLEQIAGKRVLGRGVHLLSFE